MPRPRKKKATHASHGIVGGQTKTRMPPSMKETAPERYTNRFPNRATARPMNGAATKIEAVWMIVSRENRAALPMTSRAK